MAALGRDSRDTATLAPPARRRSGGRGHHGATWLIWLLVAVAVVAGAVVFVIATGMRPSYDPFGWMVWGRQTLHGHLNLDGAPSWKPLTFVFTLPYAVFGHAQLWLWMITAVAGTLAGGVFAARIAFTLATDGADSAWARRWAPCVGALFAGAGVLGMNVYTHLVLIANSDQLDVTLCLAAIDAHLHRRHRLAFAALWLAALGRPEAWPFLGGYGLWLMWRDPGARLVALVAMVAIPASWFVIPGLASKSWFGAGDLALHQKTVIHGSKLAGVLGRWRGLYEWPMQAAAAIAMVIAMVRRDVRGLALIGLALLWVVVELVLAYRGWSAVARYLIEPAAVMIVLAGAAIGRLLGGWPAPMGPLRLLTPIIAIGLIVALVPVARHRQRAWHAAIDIARVQGVQTDRLGSAIDRAGGTDRIRACGQPVVRIGTQSTLAWFVGLNVGEVGFNPGKAILKGKPIVVFWAHDNGWRIRPYDLPPGRAASCARISVDSAMG